MRLENLPIGVFDVILLAVLVLGLLRGRKHGMSEELLHVIEWVTVLIACAFIYEPIGRMLEGSSPFSLLTSYIIVYIGSALIILTFFAMLRRSLGGKLIGSDIFGKSEYYLGMASGTIRFACVLLMGLALLNARFFSSQEVQAMERYQNDLYGSNYFPGLQTLQSTVFERSVCGPWIKDHLGLLLIKPTVPTDKALRQKEYALPR
jgi:uncharacterized membrane protein required for colicin V production